MTRNIVVVGASGFAKEVIFLLENSYTKSGEKWNIIGCIDENLNKAKTVLRYPVLGNDDFLLNYKEQINVAIGIGNPEIKKRVVEKFKRKSNLLFPNIIASTVRMGDSVILGEGCIICDMNILTTDIIIGDFVTLNLSNTIGHDTRIEDYVTINPGCNISGNVEIGKLTMVGTGTKIIQGLSIGEEAVIGAGSVIIRDVGAKTTVVGNPGRVIKEWQNQL